MSFDKSDEFGSLQSDGGEGALVEADEAGLDLTGDGARKKRMRDSTIALGLILVVAGGVLYGMRQLAMKSRPMVSDANIEKEIETALQTMFAQTGEGGGTSAVEAQAAIASLTLDRTEAQVPLEMVKKNPFILWAERSVNADEPIDEDALARQEAAERERLKELRRQNLEQQVRTLELTSVMGKGPNAVAVINDQVVQVGDEVGVDFIVEKIEPLKVTLRADTFTFVVSIDLN